MRDYKRLMVLPGEFNNRFLFCQYKYFLCLQVDIFSYAMVIYETITGRRPYQEFDNMSQISKAIKGENRRPSVKVYVPEYS